MLFYYEVKAYYDEEENNKGFLTASTFNKALDKLTDFYGEKELMSCTIQYVNEHNLVEIPNDNDSIKETIVNFNTI